ncbi:glycogen debranching protein GlgX [Paracoccus pacificus]|uniref:Glycogen debranching protein GlgX n=1 Tax=Paracoccus pacificus TaxID=1463598 RepID=A0ABW4R382_9RHOB
MPPRPARILPGRPYPMGATVVDGGVNFAVFSANATQIELCLFAVDGTETARLPLPARNGDVWHGFVPGLAPGALYGLRAHGPYAPAEGHRFNPNKLLIDPYARALHGPLIWDDALYGYQVGNPQADLSFDDRDSAPFVPRSVVTAAPEVNPRRALRRTTRDTVIYEAHVKGLTVTHPEVPADLRGKFAGLGSEAILAHLTNLGVTTVELLPVQAFLTDRFLIDRGLDNYWGYQTIGFFAPEPRYLSGAQDEFARMVDRLHGAGIEVVLDVVYNHSGEGDELGPTLSFRGLDNRSYYMLAEGGRYYQNHTGTGNCLDMNQPAVLRMVMDSMRYWVQSMGVDGFRFDLATVLTRGPNGFVPGSAFLDTLAQDPVLSNVKLIAEPWDVGPGGYRLGAFPHPFHEWNDRFRDDVRRFWRGDNGMTPALAQRLLGSAELFDHANRSAASSVNFVACHDGFTLRDVVSYSTRHNEANGEDNRDGHAENYASNMGVEGPSDDPAIIAARSQRARNMLATVMLAQGLPMILAGDEIGNSQNGNNNAYAQDNPTGWVDWAGSDPAMMGFVSRLIALRRSSPVLSQRHFLHSNIRAVDGLPDLEWRLPDGSTPSPQDWQQPEWKTLCAVIRGSAETDLDAGATEVFAVFNAGPSGQVALPSGVWRRALDTAAPAAPSSPASRNAAIAAQSVVVFTRPPGDEPTQDEPTQVEGDPA